MKCHHCKKEFETQELTEGLEGEYICIQCYGDRYNKLVGIEDFEEKDYESENYN